MRAQLELPGLPVGPDSVMLALVRRADAALVAIPREFHDWPDPPANVVHVGWIDKDAASPVWQSPWSDDRRPLVVVTLGTTYMGQEGLLGRIARALAGLPVRGLVLTGPELATDEVETTAGIEVRAYVPHAAVLPHASLVVAHAGTGTLLAAFAAGVPVLCLPLGRDQVANARRVEELGLGRILSAEATTATLGGAAEEALESSALRERAAKMASIVRTYTNGRLAVTALERLVNRAARQTETRAPASNP